MAKEATMNVRMDEDELETFKSRCSHMGREYYAVVREFITAFNEGRVKIELTDEQRKAQEVLYK